MKTQQGYLYTCPGQQKVLLLHTVFERKQLVERAAIAVKLAVG